MGARGPFFAENATPPMPDCDPLGPRALVLFSGGQDSTTCLFWALSRWDDVRALAFDYGQRHAVEIDQARAIAADAGVPFEVVDLSGLLGGSALIDGGDTNEEHDLARGLPASFVPGRNALFLTLAASRAFLSETRDLVTGVCQTDYSGYPDCRLDFVQSQEATLALALDAPVRIHTPLMRLTKAETWKLAADLGTVRGLDVLETVRVRSHTDYHGDRSTLHEWGFGTLDNPASILRAKGWEEAKANGWVR